MTFADELAGVIRYLEKLEPLPPTPPTKVTKATAAQWRSAAGSLLRAEHEFVDGASRLATLATWIDPVAAATLDRTVVAPAPFQPSGLDKATLAERRTRLSTLGQLAQHLADEAQSLHDRALMLALRADPTEADEADAALVTAQENEKAAKALATEKSAQATALSRTVNDARTQLQKLGTLLQTPLSDAQRTELRAGLDGVLTTLAGSSEVVPAAADTPATPTPHPAGKYAIGRVKAGQDSLENARAKIDACTEDPVTAFVNDLDCLAEQALDLRLEVQEALHD